MASTLVEIRARLEAATTAFDAATIPAEACARAVADAAAIEKLAGTVKALAAARVADTDLWRGEGDQTPAHELARRSGSSVKDAKDTIDVGRRLAECESVERAARRGELSTAQAAAITDAVHDTGDVELGERLVVKARRSTLRELREECLRAKAARRSGEENHRRVKAGRRVRTYTDAEGGWNLCARTTTDAGAEFMAVLQRLADRRFRAANKDGERAPAEAYLADALVDMARLAAGKLAPAADSSGVGDLDRPLRGIKVIVRIDWDALVRGWPIDGEVCEIAGLGPVPVSVVRAMIASGDAFLAALATKGHDVHTVAHLGRQATAFQATGLDWLQPTCTVDTCSNSSVVQVDHRHDWADTKVTLLRWLDRLCKHHHDLKTRENWMLVEGHGKRPMVAPDDPRHPRRAGPAAA